MGYGMKSHLGISYQQSFGTANTNSRDYVAILNETLTHDIPPLIDESLKGRYEEGGVYEGFHAFAGDVVMNINPIAIGKFLKAWCNQSSVLSLTSSCYEHVFLPATTDFDDMAALIPMTIEVYRDAGSAFQYSDMLCDALSIEFAHGALVKATASMMGGKFATLAKTTPSFPAGSSYPWNVTSVSLGGSGIDEILTLTITLSNALEAIGTLDGTKTPNRIKRAGFRTCEIAGTLLFTSQAEVDNFVNQTLQRLIVTATGETIGNSTNLFKVDIPKMRYTAMPVNIAGAGRIEVGFSARADFDETSNYLAEFTVQNTRAAY